MRVRLFIWVALALFSVPAWACPVCGSAKADNDWAFGATTLALSVLPVALFVLAVVFIGRAMKKHQKKNERAHITRFTAP